MLSAHANDAKTFLKHFSDCLFYFCSTCADSITRADESRRSKTFHHVCLCVFNIYDRTKTAENTITKLATGIVHHESLLPV